MLSVIFHRFFEFLLDFQTIKVIQFFFSFKEFFQMILIINFYIFYTMIIINYYY